jgi:hypothetical protein
MSSKTSKSRYLYLHEVADLLGIDKPNKLERIRCVRRMFRRLEQRDNAVYLHRIGNQRLKVCVDDLEQLNPYTPSSMQLLRKRLEEVDDENAELKRRVARLERFAERLEMHFKSGQPRPRTSQ